MGDSGMAAAHPVVGGSSDRCPTSSAPSRRRQARYANSRTDRVSRGAPSYLPDLRNAVQAGRRSRVVPRRLRGHCAGRHVGPRVRTQPWDIPRNSLAVSPVWHRHQSGRSESRQHTVQAPGRRRRKPVLHRARNPATGCDSRECASCSRSGNGQLTAHCVHRGAPSPLCRWGWCGPVWPIGDPASATAMSACPMLLYRAEPARDCNDVVPKGGLEPPRPKAQHPKCCVSTVPPLRRASRGHGNPTAGESRRRARAPGAAWRRDRWRARCTEPRPPSPADRPPRWSG